MQASRKKRMQSVLDVVVSPIKHQCVFFLMFVILMNYPNLVSLFSVSHSNFMDILSALSIPIFLSYILTSFIYCSKIKIVKIFCYALLFIFFLFYVFLNNVFSLRISPQVLTAILETNKSESSDFVSTFILGGKGIFCFFLVLLVIVFCLFLEKYKERIFKFRHKHIFKIIIVVLILTSTVLTTKTYINLFSIKSPREISLWDSANKQLQDPVTRTVYSLYHIHCDGKGNRQVAKLALLASKENNISLNNDSINIVLVIGESHIKHHSSLYGYYLPTQPYLEQERKNGNLFVFNDVVTTQNFTATSLRDIFSCNSVSDEESFSSKPVFPAIFKSAGFNVMFWDNQKEYLNNSGVTFSLNSFLYNKDIFDLSYNHTNKRSYRFDKLLVLNLRKHNTLLQAKNLILLHLKGQHIAANKRFPKSFAKFSYSDIRRKEKYLDKQKLQKIADYDNATLYNDYVLKTIIDLYRNENTVLIYLSDHGEEEYDYRDSEGRAFCNQDMENYLKYQYEIPFYIWCSDTYKEKNKDKIISIQRAINKRIMTDNVYNILFYLSDIQTKYYRQERDALNTKYNIKDRIVAYSINYDSVMKKNR